MPTVNALVITGYGTNCEVETAHALEQAGADSVRIAHFADLMQERLQVDHFNYLVFPGGFLDGDHLGAAQAAATRFRFAATRSGRSLLDDITALRDRGGLILGICNGFQLLAKLGLLPCLDGLSLNRQISISYNDSARFEDRWVKLRCNPDSPCVFTADVDGFYFPVRHGEGKLSFASSQVQEEVRARNLIAMHYADENWQITQRYPDNPNGSPWGIAGLTDPTGRILGLMPHPEAYNHRTNHPAWTRGEQHRLGTELFARGVSALRRTET